MNKDTQNIRGLEAAYKAVFNRDLKGRVQELANAYANLDNVCCELNPDNGVPCFWTLSELVNHYFNPTTL